MNVSGTVNKILSPIQKNAQTIGAGLEFLSMWNSNGSQIIEGINNAFAGQIHIPNAFNLLNDMKNQPTFPTLLGLTIGGYIAKEASGFGFIDKLGEAAYKAGSGGLMALGVLELLYWSTHSSLGCDKPGFTRPTSIETNFKNAPLIASAYPY